MGIEIYFRYWQGGLDGHSMFDEDMQEDLGCIHFSGAASGFQQKDYGLSFIDCLTYGTEGDDEMVGPRDTDEGWECWYTPDWPRALERAQKLFRLSCAGGQVRETYLYAVPRLAKLLSLIERCAKHEWPDLCQVRIVD